MAKISGLDTLAICPHPLGHHIAWVGSVGCVYGKQYSFRPTFLLHFSPMILQILGEIPSLNLVHVLYAHEQLMQFSWCN